MFNYIIYEVPSLNISGKRVLIPVFSSEENELNLTLPEWVFLDGNSHPGNTLENRVQLQHVGSCTIFEFFMLLENTVDEDVTVKTKKFIYTNILGADELHMVAIHHSMVDDNTLE